MGVSFNAILQAVPSYPIGKRLFHQALVKGLYDAVFMEKEGCLDLHGLSPGAAWLAIVWYFDVIVAGGHSNKAVNERWIRATLITGWGRHRGAWSQSDVKQFVCDRLDEKGIKWRLVNIGRLSVHLDTGIPSCHELDRKPTK